MCPHAPNRGRFSSLLRVVHARGAGVHPRPGVGGRPGVPFQQGVRSIQHEHGDLRRHRAQERGAKRGRVRRTQWRGCVRRAAGLVVVVVVVLAPAACVYTNHLSTTCRNAPLRCSSLGNAVLAYTRLTVPTSLHLPPLPITVVLRMTIASLLPLCLTQPPSSHPPFLRASSIPPRFLPAVHACARLSL